MHKTKSEGFFKCQAWQWTPATLALAGERSETDSRSSPNQWTPGSVIDPVSENKVNNDPGGGGGANTEPLAYMHAYVNTPM